MDFLTNEPYRQVFEVKLNVQNIAATKKCKQSRQFK